MSKKGLCACECSQVMTKAFRDLGFDMWSCDLQESYGSMPEYHIQGDAISVIESQSWDFIIAHPPCTRLSAAGVAYYTPGSRYYNQAYVDEIPAARDFFMYFYNLDIPHVIENPRPHRYAKLPEPSQSIQPYYFGDPYSKLTFLWLSDCVPGLMATCLCYEYEHWVGGGRCPGVVYSQRKRSQTFPGIANAMAAQYGRLFL